MPKSWLYVRKYVPSILKNRSAVRFYFFASVSSFEKMSVPGSSKVVLVSGANRGIGLGLVRELIRRGGCSVVATCRSPSAPSASELRTLLESSGQGWGFLSSQVQEKKEPTAIILHQIFMLHI